MRKVFIFLLYSLVYYLPTHLHSSDPSEFKDSEKENDFSKRTNSSGQIDSEYKDVNDKGVVKGSSLARFPHEILLICFNYVDHHLFTSYKNFSEFFPDESEKYTYLFGKNDGDYYFSSAIKLRPDRFLCKDTINIALVCRLFKELIYSTPFYKSLLENFGCLYSYNIDYSDLPVNKVPGQIFYDVKRQRILFENNDNTMSSLRNSVNMHTRNSKHIQELEKFLMDTEYTKVNELLLTKICYHFLSKSTALKVLAIDKLEEYSLQNNSITATYLLAIIHAGGLKRSVTDGSYYYIENKTQSIDMLQRACSILSSDTDKTRKYIFTPFVYFLILAEINKAPDSNFHFLQGIRSTLLYMKNSDTLKNSILGCEVVLPQFLEASKFLTTHIRIFNETLTNRHLLEHIKTRRSILDLDILKRLAEMPVLIDNEESDFFCDLYNYHSRLIFKAEKNFGLL